MARLQTHAWQLLALLLAALLAWQALARLGAERDAAQARADLAAGREVAATAALRASERYRKLEDKHRDELRNIDAQAQQGLARSAADADAASAAAGRLSSCRHYAWRPDAQQIPQNESPPCGLFGVQFGVGFGVGFWGESPFSEEAYVLPSNDARFFWWISILRDAGI